MTPRELFAAKPKYIRRFIDDLQSFCPEIDLSRIHQEDSDQIEIRTLEYHNVDGTRIWKLATVWFQGKPVGIFQKAGRSGRDHQARFIVDLPLYCELIAYLFSLYSFEDIDDWDVIPMDEDNPDLTEFYGSRYVQDPE